MDIFVARQDGSSLSGAGRMNHARNFERVFAFAGSGGEDIAYLHGSASDDIFVARQDGSSLSGAGRMDHARNFERVFAFAGSGGEDIAYLHGSASDDIFVLPSCLATNMSITGRAMQIGNIFTTAARKSKHTFKVPRVVHPASTR